MSYEVPRAAKLLVQLDSKYIGIGAGRTHKAGKKVKVQRSPANPGELCGSGKRNIARSPRCNSHKQSNTPTVGSNCNGKS
jgi:hypothetical protein